MDKAMNYLGLARKGGMAELGEEPVAAAARALHAHLVLVAEDASGHTWRRALSLTAGTDQQCIRVGVSKEEMGMAAGRTSLAIAAITDPALALALVRSLPEPQKYEAAEKVLAEKTRRVRQRQSEANAHRKNRRSGMKKN